MTYLKLFVVSISLLFIPVLKATSIEQLTQAYKFTNVKISPDGKHIAVRIYQDEKYSLAFFTSDTFKPVGSAKMAGKVSVGNYHWVNNERVVISLAHKKAWKDELEFYGQLFAVNYNGKKGKMIFGYNSGEMQTGSNIKKKKSTNAWGSLIDTLPEDDKHILVRSLPYSLASGTDRIAQAVVINTYSGKIKRKLPKAPINNAHFLTDKQGQLTAATGIDEKENKLVYLFNQDSKTWNKVDSDMVGQNFQPLAVSDSGNYLYALDNYNQDKTGLFKLSLNDSGYESVYTDKEVDITGVAITENGRHAYAIRIDPDYPNYLLFNKKNKEAKVFKNLLGAFPGYQVNITSQTSDGNKSIVFASSDRDPGTYYLFDKDKNSLKSLFNMLDKLNVNELAETLPIAFKTSDGVDIHGYLTKPIGKENSKNPTVVKVHGGPFGIRDYWLFDYETQVLAQAGYNVLTINFRGSGGYGVAFQQSGYKQWGGRIQQDIIEAASWAIKLGHTNKNKICIMGSSFGAYSAVQSAILAPNLFQCAIANAGIYDLVLLHEEDMINDLYTGKHFLSRTFGDDLTQLNNFSPSKHADKLLSPILIAHGKQDEIAPFEHAIALKDALDKHNKPYEWFIKDSASHGFHDEKSRLEYMQTVLTFLNKHL